MLILDVIRDYVAPVEQRIYAGDVFKPEFTAEALRHAFIEHVLRPILPARFGLMTGRAFSIDDAWMRGDNILIYDALYAMPMGHAVPCENVFAACQVTPYLDHAHFERCVLDVASLKQLHRAKASAHDVTPAHHLGVFGARYAQLSDDKLNPYLGYIFAGDSGDPDMLLKRLNELLEEGVIRPETTPDAIACFRCGWIITRQTRTGDVSVPRSSFARFGLWHPNDHLMTLIYTMLNVSLSQIQLRGPDLLRPLGALTKYR
jgi:hypothetical protein